MTILLAGAVAVVSALPYAGSWNDGSRLATVESLVDHGTLAIDNSVFVRVPEGATPYGPGASLLNKEGTKDKLWVAGHFYTDKQMVQALAMAGVYGVLQRTTGIVARENPGLFCYCMTVLSSGIAYVVAGWGIARIGRVVGLAPVARVLLTGSFLLGTAALPYVRHVNQHIVLLAVAAVLVALMFEMVAENTSPTRGRLLLMGGLAGLGYTLDLATGPLLAACIVGWVIIRLRSLRAAMTVVSALVPFVILYHVMNYSVGGTISPANSHAEFLAWEGSPFSAASATGGWKHTPAGLVVYGFELLFGTRGFVLHHPPLFLLLFTIPFFVRKETPFRVEIGVILFWSVLTWLAYSMGSNNRSGACYSIRWFVPLLAAGFATLAVLLRTRPGLAVDLGILSAAGGVLAVLGWQQGPWGLRMVPGYWVIVGLGTAGWILSRWLRGRTDDVEIPVVKPLRKVA